MSTVGVDIGDWVYEKKVRNQSSHGAVVFRQVFSHGLTNEAQVLLCTRI